MRERKEKETYFELLSKEQSRKEIVKADKQFECKKRTLELEMADLRSNKEDNRNDKDNNSPIQAISQDEGTLTTMIPNDS